MDILNDYIDNHIMKSIDEQGSGAKEEYIEDEYTVEDIEINTIDTLNEKYPLINWDLYFEKRFEFYGFKNPFIENTVFNGYTDFKYVYDIIKDIDYEDLVRYAEW